MAAAATFDLIYFSFGVLHPK